MSGLEVSPGVQRALLFENQFSGFPEFASKDAGDSL